MYITVFFSTFFLINMGSFCYNFNDEFAGDCFDVQKP